jgi:hypothetical protein
VFILQPAGALILALVTPIFTTIFFVELVFYIVALFLVIFGLTTLIRVMIFPVLSVVITTA